MLMDVLENMRWRYAVKKFDSERTLSAEKINCLKEAFNLTATSYGLQPITLLVIREKELQRRLTEHSFEQQQVVQASHVLVICIKDVVDSEYISNYFEQVQKVRNVSDEILEPFKNDLVDSFSKKDVDEIKRWSTNQAYLAMGNLLTVCAIEKIDSCPMEGFDASAFDKVLGLKKKGLKSVLVMPIGYRASDDMFASFKKVRKSIEESVIEIS